MRAGETFILPTAEGLRPMLMMWCAEAPDVVTLITERPEYAQMTAILARQMREQA